MDIKPRILIVDDEPQIGRVLKIALAAFGYHIKIAYDGLSALEIFKKWQPDLVITDFLMPGMNGLELCRELRANSDVPIILFSSNSENYMKEKALESGANDFIGKPFEISKFKVSIRKALKLNVID